MRVDSDVELKTVVCSCRSDSMTSLKSYSGLPLPRDLSADRVNDRFADRLTDPHGNGRPVFGGAGNLVAPDCNNSVVDPRMYQPHTAATTALYAGGGSPRRGPVSSIPYAISAFCLRERDASHVSLRALTRNPAAASASAAVGSSDSANLVRSRSVDQEFISRAAAVPYPSPPRSAGDGVRPSRHDLLVADLQSRVAALSRECCVLRVELERSRDQLQASAHSVRAFWSPELKRERTLRKDESARLAIVTERLRLLLRSNGQVCTGMKCETCQQ